MPRRRRMNPVSGSPPKLLSKSPQVSGTPPGASTNAVSGADNLKRSTWKSDAGSSSPSVSPPAKKMDQSLTKGNDQPVLPTNGTPVKRSFAFKHVAPAQKTVRSSASPTSTSSGSPKKTPAVPKVNERDYVCLGTKPNTILKDLSHGKEKFPVRLVNDVDDEKIPKFKYIDSREIRPDIMDFINAEHESNRYAPCCTAETCGQHCQEGVCPCRTFSGAKITYKNFLLLYNELDMYNNAIHALKECNYSCYCHNAKNKAKKGQISCFNRVFSKGAKVPVDVFRTKDRGWGVRPRIPVPEGTYIGEYVGVLKRDSPSEGVGGDYIHGLGEEVAPDIKTAVDACEKGNYTRFINHSCDPNLFVAKVAYESTNPGLFHLCLFTLRNISAYEEILIDYGHSFWDAKGHSGMRCLCGSAECHHPPSDSEDEQSNVSVQEDQGSCSSTGEAVSGSDVEER